MFFAHRKEHEMTSICEWYTAVGNGCRSCPYFIEGCNGITDSEIELLVDDEGFLQINRREPGIKLNENISKDA